MIGKPLVAGLLAAGCLGAAGAGAYVAVRQNDRDVVVAATPAAPAAPAVAETEATVTPAPAAASDVSVAPAAPAINQPLEKPAAAKPSANKAPAARSARTERAAIEPRRSTNTPVHDRPALPARSSAPAATAPVVDPAPPTATPPGRPESTPVFEPPPAVELPPAPPVREFVEVVIPASSVIGLQLESSLSSERAEVEDRVDARVTRDVTAGGRVAIPAGSRVVGSVTLVERGGKIKERARLGVRFHTVVFADGTELPIKTDAVYREGESPSGESARKIGGAAAGGAIIGAILGGGKGAVLGGAAGAAGGTAATMAGGRNPASLAAGTVITVRLSDPVSVDVEKHESERR
jgi:type IV secretory pathway VirB10-like protein